MKNIFKNIENYYSNKLKKYGPTPGGVDWNGEQGQLIRFNQLSKVIKLKNSSLNDIRDCNSSGVNLFILYYFL